jgi:hypothetical protein
MMTDARKKTQGSFQMHRHRGGEGRYAGNATRTSTPDAGTAATTEEASDWKAG